MKRGVWATAVILLLLAACIVTLCGCPRAKTGPTPTAPTEVRMGSFSKAVDYAPYLVAKNKGKFEEALKPLNVTVTYAEFQSLPPINEALASKKIDVVFEAEPPAIVGKAAGMDIKVVGLSCTLVQDILVRNGSRISAVKDLKGKKIALLAGTGAHYGVLQILKRSGLTKDDVTIVDMVPPDAKNAFETKKVDAWSVWPPFPEQEILAGTGKILAGTSYPIQSIMAVRGDFLAEHRDICKAVLGVVEDTKAWIGAHPEESQQIVAKELNLPLAVIKKAWPRHDWKAQLTEPVLADIQAKADFLKDAGFVRKSVTVKGDLMDTSLR